MIKKLSRQFKYMLLKFFRIRSSAHSISIGFALGASINFVPSFGMGLLISIAFAKLFRGNTVAAFLGGVSLMGIFPFLFYLNLVTGQFVYPYELGEMIESAVEEAASWQATAAAGFSVGRTFIIGMLINMILFIGSFYLAVYVIFKRYQKQILHLLYVKWVKQ
ncbi:DUF2062 domain-containing protein [Bacillus badius]|nr:DUF2062 domain-containing protein [Bacillus badius]KZN98661.1 hypothetical protein A4244_05990 [Bacillus badius]KZR58316.1 hypothetical protein A3781_17085 [Bacillus badius]MED4716370.1 DUF2062 domain-containing protein [Bacillus badius]OCS83602.1 hypothetical protein A6M11_05995 [Bacillus badius]OVE53113.1 hypothetical protein B1A98_05895 [Bacillus badius]